MSARCAALARTCSRNRKAKRTKKGAGFIASLFLCNEYRRETLRLPFFISKAKEPLPSAAEALWLFAVFFVFVFFLFIRKRAYAKAVGVHAIN